MTDESKQRYVCPKCGSACGFWRGVEVPGWESVDEYLKPLGRARSTDHEAMWDDAVGTGSYGCGECGWEGDIRGLTKIDLNGDPVEEPIEGQESLL